jgi:hypothetical protein
MIVKHFLIWLIGVLLSNPFSSIKHTDNDPLVPELIAESNADAPLSHVVSLDTEIGADGDFRIYVADVFASSVLVLQQQGDRLDFSGTIGRSGKGPGEFVSVNNLQMTDEQNLMVYDRNLGRITIFDAEAKKTVEVINVSVGQRKGNFPMQFYVPSNEKGSFYYARSSQFFRASDNLDEQRQILLQQYDIEGKLVKDSLLVKPDNEALVVRGEGGMAVNPQPVFGKKSIFRIKNDLIYYGWTDNNAIEIYTAEGIHLNTIELELPRMEVSQNDIMLALEKESLMMGEKKDFIRNTFLKQVPSFWPYYDNFLLDDQNRLWVAGASPMSQDSRIWYVYNLEGILLEKVSLPAGFTVFQIKNNHIIGELLDKELRSSVRIYYLS